MGLLAVIPFLEKIVDRVVPDPAQRAQLQLDLARLADQENAREAQNQLQQIELNKVEATHSNIFVAGWRPAIGWVGALSLFMYYPVQILVQLANTAKVDMDLGDLFMLIAGLLGFGGMRTFEKKAGVASEGIPAPTPIAQPAKKKGPKILPDWLR